MKPTQQGERLLAYVRGFARACTGANPGEIVAVFFRLAFEQAQRELGSELDREKWIAMAERTWQRLGNS